MIIESSIFLGLYAGLRLFERYSNKTLINLSLARHPVAKTTTTDENTDLNESTSTSSKKTADTVAKETANHHFKLSTATMGMVVVGRFYPPLSVISWGFLIYNTLPILKQTEASLFKDKEIKNDLLTAVVSVATMAIGSPVTASIQIWIYHLSCKMVNKSKDLSHQVLTGVFSTQNKKVWLLTDKTVIETPLDDINLGDILIVRTGDIIPVDGEVTKGIATLDQHVLTGESMPVEKIKGDSVFSSTLILAGEIQICVQKAGGETTVAQLNEILEKTVDYKSKSQLKGEKFSNNMALPLLAGAALLTPSLGAATAVGLLFSAPTNTVQMMTSLQTLNHLSSLVKKGIFIKDGRALENIKKIDIVFFDKTGTLTENKAEVERIMVCSSYTSDQILQYAAATEGHLKHPIANAICHEAVQRDLEALPIDNQHYELGAGISANYLDAKIRVGSVRFIVESGLKLPNTLQQLHLQIQQRGHVLIVVAIDLEVIGAIEIHPRLRVGAADVVSQLHAQGIKKVCMISGDYQQTAEHVGQQLGLDEIYAEMLPQQKADLVVKYQQLGHKVCFVGDGINDALAMKQADVSISLQSGSDVASDVAQIVLMDDKLANIPDLFTLSNELEQRLKHVMLFWGAYGIINITAISTLHLPLVKSTLLFGSVFSAASIHAFLPWYKKEDV
ncbi:MAG: heavy metal translocating P-type ATPase [Methylococcales bacterium]|nr:heavy metal translocating P-type ATPase [Methylococcales bacterium]